MAQISVTLNDLGGHFCCLKPFGTYNSGNIGHVTYGMFTHELACNFNCRPIVETEGLFKVTSSYVHCRNSNIWEALQDKDVVSTGHEIAAIPMTVSVLIASLFKWDLQGGPKKPKLNLVHFSLEIWQLVATNLMILLRINWPNFVQFSIQLDVLGSGLSSKV